MKSGWFPSPGSRRYTQVRPSRNIPWNMCYTIVTGKRRLTQRRKERRFSLRLCAFASLRETFFLLSCRAAWVWSLAKIFPHARRYDAMLKSKAFYRSHAFCVTAIKLRKSSSFLARSGLCITARASPALGTLTLQAPA